MNEAGDVLAMAAAIHAFDDMCQEGNDDPEPEKCITREWDIESAHNAIAELRRLGWRLERDPAGTVPLGLA